MNHSRSTALMARLLAPALLTGVLAAAATAAPPHHHDIAGREHWQDARIYNGIRTGALTPREAARLDRREDRTDRRIARDRRDGGRFTTRERARDERALNHDSRAIYHQKHDGQHR